EVEHQRQVVGGPPCQGGADDAGVADVDGTAAIDLVQGGQGQEGGEGAEAPGRGGQLAGVGGAQGGAAQGRAPVVVVAGDQGGQVGGLPEQRMAQQVGGLPAPLPLAQAEVPVDQVQGTFRGGHDGQLGAAGLAPAEAQRDVMVPVDRPARQDE